MLHKLRFCRKLHSPRTCKSIICSISFTLKKGKLMKNLIAIALFIGLSFGITSPSFAKCGDKASKTEASCSKTTSAKAMKVSDEGCCASKATKASDSKTCSSKATKVSSEKASCSKATNVSNVKSEGCCSSKKAVKTVETKTETVAKPVSDNN